MIIDGHSHVTLPVQEHIRAMEEAGIDKTVLFSTTFHPEKASDYTEIITSMAYLNDLVAGKKGSMVEARRKSVAELAAAVAQYPDRYIGFGAVPADLDLDHTLEYVNTVIVQNHLAGMGEFTIGSGQISLLDNIFTASREFHHLPVWVHAFSPLTLQDIRHIAELAKKFPGTPVILGHLGGTNWIGTTALVKEIPNLYLDTSACYSTLVLGAVINEIPQKCLFGVDRPFGDLQLSRDAVLKYAKTPAVSDAVLGENMAELLQLEK